MPPSEFLTDPAPLPPIPATDTDPPISPSLPSTNGDEEAALSRLADDGGPPSPPAPSEEWGVRSEEKERSAHSSLPTPHSSLAPGEAPEPPTALSLEQRVRRLEETVLLLQDRRPADHPPETRPLPPPPPTAIRLDVGKPPPVATAVPASAPSMVPSVTRSSVLWLLWDTWAESRAIVRMFVDPRYNLPWSARVLPLVLLAAILTSKYWVPFSSIPVLGSWLLVKFVDLFLAFLLFKWLGHEARRYRQTSPDLPAKLRL